jgi:anti-anti-sigma factor
MATENDATNDVLKISSHRDGAVAVIALAGELDLHGAGLLDAQVRRLFGDPVDGLEIDAGDLEFVDSSGLRSLMLARTEAEAVGASFRVTGVSPAVSRVIEIAGLAAFLLPTGPAGA